MLVQFDDYQWYLSQTRDCPYLVGNEARDIFTLEPTVDSYAYELLLSQGYRRSGHIVYRPHCGDCSECIPMRVRVSEFKLSKSQRKIKNKNQDLKIQIQPLSFESEHQRIYESYQQYQHEGAMSCSPDEFLKMFSHPNVEVLQMELRLEKQLVGVGVLDKTQHSLSSVYFYFDPDYRNRSLGVYSALKEIEMCSELSLAYWYAGFYIENCQKMDYKIRFRPYELFRDGQWQAQ